MTANQNTLLRALKRLQNRFANIAEKSRLERLLKLGRKPKIIRKKDHVSLRIYPEKNHWLPHFHIQFKSKQFSASYKIDSGERLAGKLPRQYEEEMLAWALVNKALLLGEWNALKRGTSTQLSVEGN